MEQFEEVDEDLDLRVLREDRVVMERVDMERGGSEVALETPSPPPPPAPSWLITVCRVVDWLLIAEPATASLVTEVVLPSEEDEEQWRSRCTCLLVLSTVTCCGFTCLALTPPPPPLEVVVLFPTAAADEVATLWLPPLRIPDRLASDAWTMTTLFLVFPPPPPAAPPLPLGPTPRM